VRAVGVGVKLPSLALAEIIIVYCPFGLKKIKLKHFEHCDGYRFLLNFENGEVKEADLADLIGQHVSLDALNTAVSIRNGDAWNLMTGGLI